MLKKLVPAILVGCTAVASAAQYDYDWFENRDSFKHDIRQIRSVPAGSGTTGQEEALQSYRTACDSDEACLGYNTNGWLKRAIRKPSRMVAIPFRAWNNPDWISANGIYTKKVAEGHSKTCDAEDYCTWVTTPLSSATSPPITTTAHPTTATTPTRPATEEKCVQDGDRCSSGKYYPSDPIEPCCNGGQAPSTCTEKDNTPGGHGWLCWPSFPDRYDFFRYHDSPLEDIRKIEGGTLVSLSAACDWDSECMGFNTNGWLKRAIIESPRKTPADWWGALGSIYPAHYDSAAEGLYTKKKSKSVSESVGGDGWICNPGPVDNAMYCSWDTWFSPPESTPEYDYYQYDYYH